VNGYQQLRLWYRRASVKSKAVAAATVLVVLGLLIWLIVPGAAKKSGATVASSGPAAETNSGAASSGLAQGSNAISGATGASVTGRPHTCPTGTDQGVTATEVHVAVGLIDIPGINQAFNIPTASQQQDWFGLVINAINKEGGVACRQVVATYYHINQIDPNNLEQNCLDIIASKPFAYIDDGAYLTASQKDCFPVGKIPYIGPSGVTAEEQAKFFPYFLMEGADLSQGMHNAFQAFKRRGIFTAGQGFKKEGLIYRDCTASTGPMALRELNLAGVSSAKIVTYDEGCPSGTDSPSDLLQAIVKFKHDGVTDVSALDMVGDFPNFTKLAQQQGFHPKYVMPDYGYIATASSTAQKPDANNLNGAELVSSGSFGFKPAETPATKWCNGLYIANGQPQIYDQPSGLGGVICDGLILLKNAADNAPALQRTALAAGIESAGVVDYSWPAGPGNYRGYHVTTGGQYWHSVEYSTSCGCWNPLETDWQPPFP
jgi:hypothetical protein